jgi:hypothetical protein
MASKFDRRELAVRDGREPRHVRASCLPRPIPTPNGGGIVSRSGGQHVCVARTRNYATSFRFSNFLPFDRTAMFREFRPDEIHERAHASGAAKIGMGQHP